MAMHSPPPSTQTGAGPSQIVNEFWDSFERLFTRYNERLASAGEPRLTWKELAENFAISDRTLRDWRRKRTIPSNPASLVKAATFLGGAKEEWHARWRKARDAHERLLADRQARRKPRNDENDTVSHDTIAKMLDGHSFPRWDKWEPVERALAARNAEQRDPDAEARRLQELRLGAHDYANVNETPEDIIRAPDITSYAGQIPRGAGKARPDPAADVSGLIREGTADCPKTDLETGSGRTLTSSQRADPFGEDLDAEMPRPLTTVQQIPGQDPSGQDATSRAGPASSAASPTPASHDLAQERAVAGARILATVSLCWAAIVLRPVRSRAAGR